MESAKEVAADVVGFRQLTTRPRTSERGSGYHTGNGIGRGQAFGGYGRGGGDGYGLSHGRGCGYGYADGDGYGFANPLAWMVSYGSR
jgi:hypothetical protein